MSEQSTSVPDTLQPQVEYREIAGFPGYRVGSDGSVWSSLGKRGWRRLRPYPVGGRHRKKLQHLGLSLRGEWRYVHRLVLEAFVGPCPDGMECCHEDGDTQNNSVANLRWGTHHENMLDQDRHGTRVRGEKMHSAKLVEEQIHAIHALKKAGWDSVKIGRVFGVSDVQVWRILRGENWKHCHPDKNGS